MLCIFSVFPLNFTNSTLCLDHFLHHSSTIITGGDGVAPGLVHGLHHRLVPEDQSQPRHQLSFAAITQDVNTWHLTVRRESHMGSPDTTDDSDRPFFEMVSGSLAPLKLSILRFVL